MKPMECRRDTQYAAPISRQCALTSDLGQGSRTELPTSGVSLKRQAVSVHTDTQRKAHPLMSGRKVTLGHQVSFAGVYMCIWNNTNSKCGYWFLKLLGQLNRRVWPKDLVCDFFIELTWNSCDFHQFKSPIALFMIIDLLIWYIPFLFVWKTLDGLYEKA